MDNLTCETCGHYSLYEMITQGPYSYSGDIPCFRCMRFETKRDMHTGKAATSPYERIPTWSSGITTDGRPIK